MLLRKLQSFRTKIIQEGTYHIYVKQEQNQFKKSRSKKKELLGSYLQPMLSGDVYDHDTSVKKLANSDYLITKRRLVKHRKNGKRVRSGTSTLLLMLFVVGRVMRADVCVRVREREQRAREGGQLRS